MIVDIFEPYHGVAKRTRFGQQPNAKNVGSDGIDKGVLGLMKEKRTFHEIPRNRYILTAPSDNPPRKIDFCMA
jgi:hypothetical protein